MLGQRLDVLADIAHVQSLIRPTTAESGVSVWPRSLIDEPRADFTTIFPPRTQKANAQPSVAPAISLSNDRQRRSSDRRIARLRPRCPVSAPYSGCFEPASSRHKNPMPVFKAIAATRGSGQLLIIGMEIAVRIITSIIGSISIKRKIYSV
jgi:hypothetical protein